MSIQDNSSLLTPIYILDDEENPQSSKMQTIYAPTVLDQVFDQLSPSNKTLRTIIEELRQEILTGGQGAIVFPVTSVNNQQGDVVITAATIGLHNVDNTRDIDKPLSDPQRLAVNDMLKNYKFDVDLSDLDSHLIDSNNPHRVTLEQINSTGNVDQLIKKHINSHNTSNNEMIHADIRKKIFNLESLVEDNISSNEQLINNALYILNSHLGDKYAHINEFNIKENISNKVMSFTESSNNDHIKYPSTRAVIEYVSQCLSNLKNEIDVIDQWIDDIIIISNRNELPEATSSVYRKAYFITIGNGSYAEIAICRKNNSTYFWDISPTGIYSKFNNEYFIDSSNGITLNENNIVQMFLNNSTINDKLNDAINQLMPEIIDNYYTKNEIDEFNFIKSIHIITGTTHGTIRYYINNDQSTMSDDIRISGLQRLAYLEWITENELYDQSVHSNHIINGAVQSRHIDNEAVHARHLSAKYGYILMNSKDYEGTTVTETSMQDLASLLSPYININIDGIIFSPISNDNIIDKITNAFDSVVPDDNPSIDPDEPIDPSIYIKFSIENNYLILEYDSDSDPDIYIDNNGELVLNSFDTKLDKELSKYHFEINNGYLIISFLEDNVPLQTVTSFTIKNGELILEYPESEINPPNLFINKNGELILENNNSDLDNELSQYKFNIVDSQLIVETSS